MKSHLATKYANFCEKVHNFPGYESRCGFPRMKESEQIDVRKADKKMDARFVVKLQEHPKIPPTELLDLSRMHVLFHIVRLALATVNSNLARTNSAHDDRLCNESSTFT